MSTLQIVRAWKDQSYRNSLSADQLAKLPAHPSGVIEFDCTAVAAQTNGKKCAAPPPTTALLCTYWCGPIYTVNKSAGSTCV